MIEIVVTNPEVAGLLRQHALTFPGLHTNLESGRCVCRRAVPGLDGPTCPHCGGMTRRAGTCAICTNCGETTGCG